MIDKCFPSNEEFIKVQMEEDNSSSRATSSTDSTLPTRPVEIPIRKSMSQDFSSIRISHGRMMYNVRKAIRNHQVDFDELIDFTISCSSDIEDKLDKSFDVASVLRVIEKKECSLIDTSLISAVVEEFRVTEAERYIEEYKEKLREFCRSISVTLCLKEKFEANPSLQCETATYVFDWRPDEKKLKDITDILSKTSDKFVKVKFIDTGYSIVITCSFPHSLIGALITQLIENLDVLIKNGLKKITIGCCLIWEEQKLEEREQLLEEDIDAIKASQEDIREDPYDLQEKPVRIEKKKKQLIAPDSGLQSIDTSFTIVTSQLKKEKETNKRLEEKLQKVKEKHCIQHMLLLTNTGSALSRIRRGMRMEIEDLILYLTATKSDLQDQNAALAENKREMEYLQEQISSTSVQLLMKREENEKYKAAIKDEISHKEKKLLKDEVVSVANVQSETKDEEKLIKKSENSDTLLSLQRKPWFHENVKSKADADAILEDFKHIPGAFIVTKNFFGYFLSFVHNFRIHYLSISEVNDKEGKINYRISGFSRSFVSIVDLVNHYRLYYINIDQISQVLTVPISKNKLFVHPLTHKKQPWYNKDVDRNKAEYMLERVIPKEDGAFLVRPSSEGDNKLAISFISGNSIRHFIIVNKGDGQFEIGHMTFDSMIELVDYFKQYPIYADTKLKYPINEEILNQKYPTHEFIRDVLPYRH